MTLFIFLARQIILVSAEFTALDLKITNVHGIRRE